MVRTKSIVRSVCLLVLLAGTSLAPARAGKLPSGPLPTGSAEVRAQLRHLLRSDAESQPAADHLLGLKAGSAVRAFYAAPHNDTAYWMAETGWTPRAHEALRLLGRAADLGLPPARYGSPALHRLPDSLRATATADPLGRAELRLTDALLRYLSDLQRGHLVAGTLTPLLMTDSLAAPAAAQQLHRVLDTPDLTRTLLGLQPPARAYRLLQTAWQRALHATPADSVRLMADTTAGFRRVALNLERLRWAAPADSEYAVVNIPAYRLQVLRHEQVVLSQHVIVGKPEFATPTISSRIGVFVVAPEWRVPYSIAVREFLPELQRDPGYLADHHYRLYDGRDRLVNPWNINWKKITPETFVYAIRQRAGSYNALGNVVFYFGNRHAVFLHDTPGRSAFKKPQRALSHGCVRVETPFKLADYLLRREGRARELPAMYRSVQAHQTQTFELRRSLPIYLRYYTCETDNGRLVFLPDIYGRDARLAAALFADPGR